MELSQTLFNLLIAICGSLGGSILWVMWTMIQGLQAKKEAQDKEIADVKAGLARDYVPRFELDTYLTRLEAKIDKGFDRVFDKLDKKVDK